MIGCTDTIRANRNGCDRSIEDGAAAATAAAFIVTAGRIVTRQRLRPRFEPPPP